MRKCENKQKDQKQELVKTYVLYFDFNLFYFYQLTAMETLNSLVLFM
jgi:hypothetical protein